MKTLHILNGDATLAVFKETAFTGDIIVWREILADGPVSAENLWELRSNWICKIYGDTPENYNEKVLQEVDKLNHVRDYEEIILWFEYDLTCQINLICILSILNAKDLQIPIQLVCPDSFPNKPNFRGLGELTAAELTQLYPDRKTLNNADISLATKAWGLYIANDAKAIEQLLTADFGNLNLLKTALKAHLSRYPKSNQLNYIDEVLLEFIKQGKTTKMGIYEAFWLQESIFGMTDLQIDYTLNKLKARGLISKELF